MYEGKYFKSPKGLLKNGKFVEVTPISKYMFITAMIGVRVVSSSHKRIRVEMDDGLIFRMNPVYFHNNLETVYELIKAHIKCKT